MDLHLAETLTRLAPPARETLGNQFRVCSIPAAPEHYVGLDSSGYPCILLRGSTGPMRSPIRLAALEARFAVPCQIIATDGKERQETLTVVICTSADPHTQSYFLHICETIIRIVGVNPSLAQIVDAVQRLVDLFRRLSQPASRSVIGLFGELYVISRSNDPRVAVRAWRSADDDRFDFAIDDVRLEVKASGQRIRAHNFSAEQCLPPSGTIGVLISLFIETTGGGLSLTELVQTVARRLAGDEALILKVQETVAETLGETLLAALSIRFDERLAQTSLQIYDVMAIPAIRAGVPAEVTQVHFRSDLSRTPTISLDELVTRSACIAAFLPSTT
jgi:hypothetical protein